MNMLSDHHEASLERALSNPSQIFKSPMEVVEDRSFSHAEKLKILQQWEMDAHELMVAEEENMGGGERSRLREVEEALRALDQS